MFKLFKYFKFWEWVGCIVVLGATVGRVLCELELPGYMAQLIGYIAGSVQYGLPLSSAQVWQIGGKMLGFVAASIVIAIACNYLSSIISTGVAKRLRSAMFNKVGTFGMSEINKFSTASLITRSTNDISQVQQLITMFLRMFMFSPIMAITAIIKICALNVTLTWVTFAFVGGMFIFLAVLMLLVFKKFGVMQKQTDALNGVARENLTGLRVVRANNAEAYQQQKFEQTNSKLASTTLYVDRAWGVLMPFMTLVMSGLQLAIYWIGAFLIKDPAAMLNYAGVTEFAQYAVQVLMSFTMISAMFVLVPRAAVSARRVTEVLNTPTSLTSGSFNGTTEVTGKVEFKNVSFKYPGAEEYVLEDISFTAKRGQTVAFIGSTGSGKSTLVNLITRFYDATEGEVLLDDINVKEYKFGTLNKKLGYIPQKAILFSGSVYENITYGAPEATNQDIEKALEVSQSKDFVEKLSGKMNFYVAQGGKNLSGGQKQRLSIARALVKNPEVLIFDDSFSALDYQTDKKLRTELAKHYADVTKIVVAQRIGTILSADQIIVLDNGKMVGKGTHKQLIKNCKVYQEIAYSQLSKEELDNE